MQCPLCGHKTDVIASYAAVRGEVATQVRRRKCDGCKARFATQEVVTTRGKAWDGALRGTMDRTAYWKKYYREHKDEILARKKVLQKLPESKTEAHMNTGSGAGDSIDDYCGVGERGVSF